MRIFLKLKEKTELRKFLDIFEHTFEEYKKRIFPYNIIKYGGFISRFLERLPLQSLISGKNSARELSGIKRSTFFFRSHVFFSGELRKSRKKSEIINFFSLIRKIRVSTGQGNREKPRNFFNQEKPWKLEEFYLGLGFFCFIPKSTFFLTVFLLRIFDSCALGDKFHIKKYLIQVGKV